MTPEEYAYNQKWAMWLHAAGLACFVLPYIGNLVAVYLIWEKKRTEKSLFYEHGLEAFNFQLSMTIYFGVATLLLLVWVGIFFMIGLAVFQLLAIGLAVLRAHDLEVYQYPFNLRLIQDDRPKALPEETHQ